MIASHVIEALRRCPVVPYLEEINQNGRQAIDPDMQQRAASLYDFAEGMLTFETSLDHDARTVLKLAKDALYSEKYLLTHEKPRYVMYSNLDVLNRFLLDGKSAALGVKWEAAKRALALVLRDWHDREQDRLSAFFEGTLDRTLLGFEAVKEEERSVSHIQERERSLSSLSRFAAVTGLPDTTLVLNEVHKHETDWSYFAADPARQITHLTCLPRSRWHDEYMFLRTIHATECCYSGILASLSALPGFIRNRDFISGTEILKGALFFSDFLSKLFAIFDTMPVAHFFDGFRTATGDASAIQSVRFQTIEVLTRGLGSPKREALTHQHEARFASNWQPPNDATLVGMCEIARQQQSEGSDFIEIAEILDRDLYKWRARHFGIARKYLPANAIGTGNEGTPYLAANYRDPRSATGMKDVPDTNDRHLNDELARVTLSFGLRPNGSPPVAVIRGSDIHATAVQEAVDVRKSALQSLMKSREGFINSTLSHYAGFFGTHPYPVERQVTAFRKKPTLSGPVIPALLLSIELGTGGLMGLHDTSRMSGQIIFDTASEGENFQGIRGKLIRCDAGELIVRDDRGVIASIYQGPDKRTAASFEPEQENTSWTLLVFGYPSMARADFDILVGDAKEFVSLLGAQNVQVWSSYEH